MAKDRPQPRFAICIKNDEYPASLEIRKIYEVASDPEAAAHGMIRVIDESGEDYLYPKDHFIPVELPKNVEEILAPAV